MADFEKEPNAVQITVSDLEKDGFGSNAKFNCFVAEIGNEIVGLALVYPRYSTWCGPTLHLEDLIVTKAKRAEGIGSALLRKVVHYGHSKGVKRISWEVLDWNDTAITFYEKKGARVFRDWNVVHLDHKGMKKFMGA